MKTKRYRLIIAGSRDFNDYSLLPKHLDTLLTTIELPVQIISGGARGADRLGERYAREHKLLLRIIKPDWDRYGKSAGFLRNEKMAKFADGLMAFWDGNSRGTEHMIFRAEERGMDVWIINV